VSAKKKKNERKKREEKTIEKTGIDELLKTNLFTTGKKNG
jgi:hypothetical protein